MDRFGCGVYVFQVIPYVFLLEPFFSFLTRLIDRDYNTGPPPPLFSRLRVGCILDLPSHPSCQLNGTCASSFLFLRPSSTTTPPPPNTYICFIDTPLTPFRQPPVVASSVLLPPFYRYRQPGRKLISGLSPVPPQRRSRVRLVFLVPFDNFLVRLEVPRRSGRSKSWTVGNHSPFFLVFKDSVRFEETPTRE